MPRIARVLVATVLLAIVAFCAFGFLATFEPPGFVAMRIGYGIVGLACFGGAVWALLAKRRGA